MPRMWYLFNITILSFLLISCQQPAVVEIPSTTLSQLTDDQIIQFNQQSCDQQDRYQVLVPLSHQLQLRLNRLTHDFPTSINGKTVNYRIYLNTQKTAWASLNGCVRIMSGLMNQLTDNEVKAVIAHELGHIALNHSISSFRAAKSAEIGKSGKIILIMKQSLAWQHEYEADNYAVYFLQKQNIDPNNLILMLNKLYHDREQVNLSHPSLIDRKQNILKQLMN